MHLIATVIRMSHANFHCSRLTTVQDIQDHTSLIFGTCTFSCRIVHISMIISPRLRNMSTKGLVHWVNVSDSSGAISPGLSQIKGHQKVKK